MNKLKINDKQIEELWNGKYVSLNDKVIVLFYREHLSLLRIKQGLNGYYSSMELEITNNSTKLNKKLFYKKVKEMFRKP